MMFARRKVELSSTFRQDTTIVLSTNFFYCACVVANFSDDRLKNRGGLPSDKCFMNKYALATQLPIGSCRSVVQKPK